MTNCGFELEVSGGSRNVLAGLRHYGLTGHTVLHGYHCGCEECRPDPLFGSAQRPFKAQCDCTADGEFISGILEYGSETMDDAIIGLGHVLLKAKHCSTSGNVGNHVHVGRENIDDVAAIRLQRMFGRYANDLREIASGNRSDMRGYNGRLEVPRASDPMWTAETDRDLYDWGGMLARNGACAHNLAFKSRTVEFRLWNSVKAPWRIRTHVGLSVAMVEAAIAGQDATHDDTRILEDVIGDFIDSDTWAGILRQRYSKGGLA